jgi:hypothetical protein
VRTAEMNTSSLCNLANSESFVPPPLLIPSRDTLQVSATPVTHHLDHRLQSSSVHGNGIVDTRRNGFLSCPFTMPSVTSSWRCRISMRSVIPGMERFMLAVSMLLQLMATKH